MGNVISGGIANPACRTGQSGGRILNRLHQSVFIKIDFLNIGYAAFSESPGKTAVVVDQICFPLEIKYRRMACVAGRVPVKQHVLEFPVCLIQVVAGCVGQLFSPVYGEEEIVFAVRLTVLILAAVKKW